MILSGEEIRRRHGSEIVIDPFDPQRINPNSYNLTLHDELLVYEEVVLDVAAPNRYARVRIPEEGLTLHPGQLYLGRTVERTETQQLVPRIQQRAERRVAHPGHDLHALGLHRPPDLTGIQRSGHQHHLAATEQPGERGPLGGGMHHRRERHVADGLLDETVRRLLTSAEALTELQFEIYSYAGPASPWYDKLGLGGPAPVIVPARQEVVQSKAETVYPRGETVTAEPTVAGSHASGRREGPRDVAVPPLTTCVPVKVRRGVRLDLAPRGEQLIERLGQHGQVLKAPRFIFFIIRFRMHG
jgi:hypothetical protein